MGVEILILSGARQGEHVLLDADEIRAGGSGACDVFFDPADDAAAKGRIALFRRSEEGWSIQNVGNGELMLNQETVSDRTRIRSGDIVRLSDHGPDFSFEILAGRASFWSDNSTEKTTPRAPPAETPRGVPEMPPPVIASDDVLQSGVTAESSLPPIAHPASSRKRNVLIAAIAGCGVLAVLVLLAAGVFGPADEDAGPVAAMNNSTVVSEQLPDQHTPPTGVDPPKPSPTPKETSVPPKTSVTPPAQVAPNTTPANTQAQNSSTPGTPPADPWTQIERQYEKTVWLLQVVDPDGKFVYPFATAVAIGRQTLLSTATVAAELHKFTARGWKVQAGNTALKKTVGLDKIRMYALYAAFDDNPQKKIYADLGVLTTRQPLSAVAPLASAAELAGLDTGAELACMGIAHQGDAIKADDARSQDALVPELIGCKLFLRTQFDPKSPSSPRLLHLKALPSGDLSGNFYGSPIIDSQGKVVAVYADAAVGEGKQLRLHYAVMIDPAIIKRAITEQDQNERAPGGKDAKLWVTPTETGKQEPARKNN